MKTCVTIPNYKKTRISARRTLLDLAQGATATRRWLLPQLILVIVLIWLQQPIAALALLALLIAQALLATAMTGLDYRASRAVVADVGDARCGVGHPLNDS